MTKQNTTFIRETRNMNTKPNINSTGQIAVAVSDFQKSLES